LGGFHRKTIRPRRSARAIATLTGEAGVAQMAGQQAITIQGCLNIHVPIVRTPLSGKREGAYTACSSANVRVIMTGKGDNPTITQGWNILPPFSYWMDRNFHQVRPRKNLDGSLSWVCVEIGVLAAVAISLGCHQNQKKNTKVRSLSRRTTAVCPVDSVTS
jgi:hypothetical protein